MALTNAITDLIKSIGELLSSIFGTAFSIVHSFVAGILSLFTGFFAFVGDLGKGVLDLVGGVGKFIAGNAVILAVIAAAGYAYMRFVQQPQQGRRPAAVTGTGKKTN